MPYIKKENREKFDCPTREIGDMVGNEGELNYVITSICHQYIKKHGLRYHNCARIRGVLADVSSELYRRVFARYEDQKIEENGDLEILDQ